MKIYKQNISPKKVELYKKLTKRDNITPEEVAQTIANAKRAAMDKIPVSERAILSIYDYTGEWARPYAEAGYPVLLWDYKIEGDIFQHGLSYLPTVYKCDQEPDAPYTLYGLLAAPPCTDFAQSGSQWWAAKDKSTERKGWKDEFANSVEQHQFMVMVIDLLVEWFKPKFWVAENPVGRLEKFVPEWTDKRSCSFDPCDFGDPYTKKTILYGNFNPNLPMNPVEPEYIIQGGKKFPKIWAGTGGKSEKTKAIRSATPKGFANAFFQANQ